MNYYAYKTPFGHVTISSDGSAITDVVLGEATLAGDAAPNAVTNACANQLLEYFAGKRMVFDVPLSMQGSDFQIAVWKALRDIPYGQTRTPKELAEQMGMPSSYRLVTKVAYANQLAIIVPAHRLVAASGQEADRSRAAELRRACRELEKRFR